MNWGLTLGGSVVRTYVRQNITTGTLTVSCVDSNGDTITCAAAAGEETKLKLSFSGLGNTLCGTAPCWRNISVTAKSGGQDIGTMTGSGTDWTWTAPDTTSTVDRHVVLEVAAEFWTGFASRVETQLNVTIPRDRAPPVISIKCEPVSRGAAPPPGNNCRVYFSSSANLPYDKVTLTACAGHTTEPCDEPQGLLTYEWDWNHPTYFMNLVPTTHDQQSAATTECEETR